MKKFEELNEVEKELRALAWAAENRNITRHTDQLPRQSELYLNFRIQEAKNIMKKYEIPEAE